MDEPDREPLPEHVLVRRAGATPIRRLLPPEQALALDRLRERLDGAQEGGRWTRRGDGRSVTNEVAPRRDQRPGPWQPGA